MAKRKTHKGLIAVLTVLLIAILGVLGYLVYTAATNDINGVKQETKEYTLIIGSQNYEEVVGADLADNGIVLSDVLWTNWMANHYPDFEYVRGEYTLTADMSYEAIAEKLQDPDISHEVVKVVIPEGFNCMDIAARLEENGICSAQDFLAACETTEGYDYNFIKEIPDNALVPYKLEGFLFPATYDFAMNSDAHKIADIMLGAFADRRTEAMDQFCEAHDMTLYELITLASVVQEEALTNESAQNIASVFMNRLNSGMQLQSDVTIFYARALRDTAGISPEAYDAYNTYECKALPAGPITNSGEAVIDAVLHYPETNYIFFFSDLQQEFHFAETYQEFEQLKEQYPWKE